MVTKLENVTIEDLRKLCPAVVFAAKNSNTTERLQSELIKETTICGETRCYEISNENAKALFDFSDSEILRNDSSNLGIISFAMEDMPMIEEIIETINISTLDELITNHSKNTIERVEVTTKEEIKDLGSALTFLGIEASDDSLTALFNWIEKYTAIERRLAHIIKGSTMNDLFDLHDENRYDDDLTIVCVDMRDVVTPANLVLPRLSVDGHWLDDVIDNLVRG